MNRVGKAFPSLQLAAVNSLSQRDAFHEALDHYDDVLKEYTVKLTIQIAAMPQGFGKRQDDIDRTKHTIRGVHDFIDLMHLLLNSKHPIAFWGV